jgi:hypothetical protein
MSRNTKVQSPKYFAAAIIGEDGFDDLRTGYMCSPQKLLVTVLLKMR